MLTHGSTFAYLCCKNITTNDPAKGLAKVPMGLPQMGITKKWQGCNCSWQFPTFIPLCLRNDRDTVTMKKNNSKLYEVYKTVPFPKTLRDSTLFCKFHITLSIPESVKIDTSNWKHGPYLAQGQQHIPLNVAWRVIQPF